MKLFNHGSPRTLSPETGSSIYRGPWFDSQALRRKICTSFSRMSGASIWETTQAQRRTMALQAFMAHCSERIGDAYFRTPRNTVTAFVNMLSVIEQNPGTAWQDLVGGVEIVPDGGDDLSDIIDDEASESRQEDDDDLASFRL